MTPRLIVCLVLVIPHLSFAGVPESMVGRWQFDSVCTINEFVDQVFAAHPEMATPDQIQTQKATFAKQGAQTDLI